MINSYEIRMIESTSHEKRSIRDLGDVVATARDIGQAKSLAASAAQLYYYGVAIVDTAARTIDWGDETTDYQGGEVR